MTFFSLPLLNRLCSIWIQYHRPDKMSFFLQSLGICTRIPYDQTLGPLRVKHYYTTLANSLKLHTSMLQHSKSRILQYTLFLKLTNHGRPTNLRICNDCNPDCITWCIVHSRCILSSITHIKLQITATCKTIQWILPSKIIKDYPSSRQENISAQKCIQMRTILNSS